MVRLKKMLGDINSKECQNLMYLIETQSKETLANWAIDYAYEKYFPIYSINDNTEELIERCKKAINDKSKLPEAKLAIKQMRQSAKEIANEPVNLAAIKAISTACATIQTPSNAFGFLLYGSAAIAYFKLGLESSQESYDDFASNELKEALTSLQKRAILNEPKPVKIKWNC